ncbi:hypothetical protein MLD38_012708 [Melastoma candidum]|uniref:Uncharacterized protein n=1 Tax=Melastoma candidum TaxID=119954 RepID=A0ACB9RAB4_9MYRT|nr:hypothetical protein MLD38_012708 [Melastoma candidum]
MPTVWLSSLRKSLYCKSQPSEIHHPKHLASVLSRKSAAGGGGGRSGCSRSISKLRDVIHGSKRHLPDPPASCSPRSIGSSEFHNSLYHEVVLGSSGCQLKITGGGCGASCALMPPRKNCVSVVDEKEGEGGVVDGHAVLSGGGRGRVLSNQVLLDAGTNNVSSITCHKCGEQFGKLDAAEAHHLSKHAMTELVEGDSSRKIVEIICRTGWTKSETRPGRIDKVLKVHNMQQTLARFEEYRETVKIRASKLPKKHPRCLADGNELLRFYGTTVSCSLGLCGTTSPCSLDRCHVCHVIRDGFSGKREMREGIGVFTTSTSGTAFDSIDAAEDENEHQSNARKALIVCRVIAGRVHRPLENIREMVGQSGFDSLAGKVGLYSHIEELYLLNPRALLPCFVVICKT